MKNYAYADNDGDLYCSLTGAQQLEEREVCKNCEHSSICTRGNKS